MNNFNQYKKLAIKLAVTILAMTAMAGKPALAAPGNAVQLNKNIAIYLSAYDASHQKNQVATYSKGNYFIFSEHNPTGTLNITKKKGTPGAWVKKSLVTLKESPVASNHSSNNSRESKLTQSGYTKGGVSFRLIPNLKGSRLCVIPKGSKLSAQKHNSNWVKVEYKGKIGYIHTSLFSFNNQQQSTQISTQQSTQQYIKPLPVKGYSVTSEFGDRIHPITGKKTFHGGIDLAAPSGTGIFAIADGQVTSATFSNGYGNFVMVKHSNGIESLYAHMSKRALSVGDRVSKGQVVGFVGTTGRSTGNHLHFEIRKNGVQINPRKSIQF